MPFSSALKMEYWSKKYIIEKVNLRTLLYCSTTEGKNTHTLTGPFLYYTTHYWILP
jgi:hypothetical protein